MPSYIPATGVTAKTILNNVELSMRRMDWDASIDSLDVSAFTGRGNAERTTGKKSAVYKINGVYALNFNPNNTLKLGQVVSAQFVVDNANIASDGSAQIVGFHVISEARGVQELEIDLESTWIFNDFSGGPA